MEITPEAFARIGNNYKEWTRAAQQLYASAFVLRRERDKTEAVQIAGVSKAPIEALTLWVELMLLGFAIECLLKAFWVRKGNKAAENGCYVPVMKPENHDLVKLCRTVSFQTSDTEDTSLKKLTDLVRATGRYPIARRFAEMRNESTWWSSEEDEVIQGFISRLKLNIAGWKAK